MAHTKGHPTPETRKGQQEAGLEPGRQRGPLGEPPLEVRGPNLWGAGGWEGVALEGRVENGSVAMGDQAGPGDVMGGLCQ